MEPLVKTALWQQFGASINMFENALLACPDAHWRGRLWNVRTPEFGEFWYVTYHALFWCDLYLTGVEEGFAPPAPFTLAELDPAGVLPEQPYTRDELHTYLKHLREKCRMTIAELTEEKAHRQVYFPWSREESLSFLELLMYNMRHMMEHTGHLSMFLGQNGVDGESIDWVPRAGAD